MNNQPNPLDEELLAWKQHPFTERFFNYLKLLENAAKEDWAKEQFVGDTLDQWALQNAKALGGVQVLMCLQLADAQDIIDAEKEAYEQVRN